MSSLPHAGRVGTVLLFDELDVNTSSVEELAREGGFELLPTKSIPELMRALSEHHPEIVVLDVGCADRARIKLIQFMASQYPQIGVVGLADDRQAALLSVQAGARSAIPKPLDMRALRRTLYAELMSGTVVRDRADEATVLR